MIVLTYFYLWQAQNFQPNILQSTSLTLYLLQFLKAIYNCNLSISKFPIVHSTILCIKLTYKVLVIYCSYIARTETMCCRCLIKISHIQTNELFQVPLQACWKKLLCLCSCGIRVNYNFFTVMGVEGEHQIYYL